MGRATFHYTRLQVPSSLALNTSRDGACTSTIFTIGRNKWTPNAFRSDTELHLRKMLCSCSGQSTLLPLASSTNDSPLVELQQDTSTLSNQRQKEAHPGFKTPGICAGKCTALSPDKVSLQTGCWLAVGAPPLHPQLAPLFPAAQKHVADLVHLE